MLILTRKLNEEIVIGDQKITVTIVDVSNGRVRLGIQAPREVRIERRELTGAPRLESSQAEPAHS